MSTKIAQQMQKIMPTVGNIASMLDQQKIQGPMTDYAKARMSGREITPDLARSAWLQASKLVQQAKAQGKHDIEFSPTKRLSAGTVEALMYDIMAQTKIASAKETILKLARKFEKKAHDYESDESNLDRPWINGPIGQNFKEPEKDQEHSGAYMVEYRFVKDGVPISKWTGWQTIGDNGQMTDDKERADEMAKAFKMQYDNWSLQTRVTEVR